LSAPAAEPELRPDFGGMAAGPIGCDLAGGGAPGHGGAGRSAMGLGGFAPGLRVDRANLCARMASGPGLWWLSVGGALVGEFAGKGGLQ